MELLSSPKTFFVLGAFFALIAVAAGAFGAHALKQKLTPEHLSVFEVAVRYQLYHALALLILAQWSGASPFFISLASWLFIAGITIFSGSLYILVLTGIATWGAITPIGGILLLAGWTSLIIGTLK